MKCIYLRTNIINGKQYVGQANDFEKREQDWMCDSRYSGGVIDKARAKYGVENFKVEILRECKTKDELNYWEKYYISELNTKVPNGYNLTDGGEGAVGVIISEESRKKMSEVKKGCIPWNKGIPASEEQKKRHSEIMKGHIPWNKGICGYTTKKRKRIYQYNLDGTLINIYDSVKEAAEKTNANPSGIVQCCKGIYNKSKGFKWSYK